MKMISMVVVIMGVISMVMAPASKLFGGNIAGVSPSGFLQGATALYLLALVIMCCDKLYCGKQQP
jgi:hypothetical protein